VACWQNGTAYDPTRHKALKRVLTYKNKINKGGGLTQATHAEDPATTVAT
jgi:hypothetical protein